MLGNYAEIEVIRSEDKAIPENWNAHREVFTKRIDDNIISFKEKVAETIKFSFEIQKALNACTKGLKEINHPELIREIHKIRLMEDHYDGAHCIWDA